MNEIQFVNRIGMNWPEKFPDYFRFLDGARSRRFWKWATTRSKDRSFSGTDTVWFDQNKLSLYEFITIIIRTIGPYDGFQKFKNLTARLRVNLPVHSWWGGQMRLEGAEISQSNFQYLFSKEIVDNWKNVNFLRSLYDKIKF